MPTVGDLCDHLDRFAPTRLAADWDNVGLLLGSRAADVTRVLTCLTLTPAVAAEAVAQGAQLIVTHHPILFRAVKRLTDATPEGKMLLALARAGVAVHSPHTAFDNTRGGINDSLCDLLGVTDAKPLRSTAATAKQVKLVVFVPEPNLAAVQEAVFAAGAGRIGEYDECGYRLSGVGTFRGSDKSNPVIGRRGVREHVNEARLETVVAESKVPAVVAALRKAHPYEEPAFDLVPLAGHPTTTGEGRLGDLREPTTLGDFARLVREKLACGPVATVGDQSRTVRRVAIVCGAGGEMLSDAIRARADVFLTGEMRYHDYLRAEVEGVALVLPGHHATERPGVEMLARKLAQDWPSVTCTASEAEREPVGYV